MAGFLRRIEDLSPEARALLARRLGVEGRSPVAEEPREDAGTRGRVPRLVAYVVASGEPPLESELRRALGSLPEFMVPSDFVVLGALPRTPNGKVDMKALPAPRREGALTAAQVGPRDATERRLARIWAAVLGRDGFGIHDDFFDLGGHSFLALEVFIRIQKEFGRSFPLATLLENPTVARLASILRPASPTERSPCLVAIQEGGPQPPLFGFHCVAGSIFHYRALARRLGEDQPVYGVQPAAMDGTVRLPDTVEGMAVGYADAIDAARPEGPLFLCGYSFGGILAFETARRLREKGRDVRLVALFDTLLPWDEPLEARLREHRTKLARLGVRGKLAYLAEKAFGNLRTLVREVWDRSARLSKSVRCRLYLALRRPLPVRLQDAYFRGITYRAFFAYRPRPYDGEVTLFRQEGRSWFSDRQADLGWGKLVEPEKLRLIDFPGHHGDMLQEPAVARVAERIRQDLVARM